MHKFYVHGERISLITLLIISYLLISTLVSLFHVQSVAGVYISFREVVLPFLLILAYSDLKLPAKYWQKMIRVLMVLCVLNLIFIGLTYAWGPERYMTSLTGRFVWPVDPDYKFKISNIFQFWRSPALMGEAASVAYFGLFTFLIMDNNPKYKWLKVIPLALVVLSFTRSAYLVLFIYAIFRILTKKHFYKYLEKAIALIAPLLLVLLVIMYQSNLLSLNSVQERFYLWFNDVNNSFNWLFGGQMGEIGGAVRGAGFVSTMDSYWLMLLYSVGLFGILFLILLLRNKTKGYKNLNIILIGLSLSAFFVTLSQSITFLVLFPLLFMSNYILGQESEKANRPVVE